ncbi:S8 family serine peptidase [[Phormidium] sp. ETS-05]|uniref:S8 family serine peptidase n=1 Tax=[Phormidium] sp. ETS-05 TaxID=222819 RepID=UPI0018EEE00F|nr:S8 family serine peptidase [[Phormidium] sp. ETS-05]
MPDYGISVPEQSQDTLIIDPIESGLTNPLIPQPLMGAAEPEKPNQGDLVEPVEVSDTTIVELTGLATTDIIPLAGFDTTATESKLASDDGAERDPITGVTTGDELKGITDEIESEPLINPPASDDGEEIPAAILGGELEPEAETTKDSAIAREIELEETEIPPQIVSDSDASDDDIKADESSRVENAADDDEPVVSDTADDTKADESSLVENAADDDEPVVSDTADDTKADESSLVENAADDDEPVVSDTADDTKADESSLVENAADDDEPVVSDTTDNIKIEQKPEITKSDDQVTDESATQSDTAITAEILDKKLTPTPNFENVQPIFESGTFKVDSTGQVGLDYIFDGGGFQGQLAIISLSGMAEFEPGSPEFLKEAARRALSGSEEGHIVIDDVNEGAKFSGYLGENSHNFGNYQGVKTFAMRPGDTFGVMLIPNGTVQEVFNNPAVGANKRPLFSMVTANPNLAFHLGQIADVTGEGNTFVMEDLRADNTRFDRDYNDIIFQVRGAVGKAVLMDEVVAAGKDWRQSDLGKGLIAYAKSYINPEPIEEVDAETEPESPISTEPVTGIDDETTKTETELVTGIDDDSTTETETTTEPVTGIVDDSTTETETEPVTGIVDDSTTETETEPVTGIDDDSTETETETEPVTGIDDDSTETETEPVTGIDDDSTETETEPVTGIDDETTTEPETGTGTDVISEQPTTEPETGTGTDVIDDETTTEPTTGTGTDVIGDETTTEPTTGTGTDVIGDETTTEPTTGTGTDVIGDETTPTTGTGTDVVSDETTTEPTTGTGSDVVSEQPTQPNNPAPVNEKPVEIIDILTGEKITPPPSPSIPELQISQPQGSKNQPITGTIAPKDNQPQNWASSLVEFVDTAVKSGQSNAVININIDFTKIQTGSDTSPLQLTTEEKAALEYAQENNVLVVVPVGDTPGQLSALAEVAKEFNNIITVGAAQRVNNAVAVSKAFAPLPNSGSGSNLDIMAEGINGNASGTTVAAAKATEAMAKVWAANPKLDYTQVIDIVKRTATDLALPNWDAATGAGMVNTEAAVWLAKVTQPVIKQTISLVPVADVELTPEQPTTNIDLSKVLVGKNLIYEIVGAASDAVAVKLTGSELQLSGLAKSGLTDVTIRATDAKGKSVETKFSVTNYYLEPTSVSAANTALTELTTAINSIPGDLVTALSGDAAAASLENLLGLVEENPQLVQLLAKPEILAQLGMDSSGLATLQQLLNSPELAQELGLKGTVAEAFSNPDSTALDSFLLNADEAVALLPENAKQPKVGFIDFTQGNHIQQVTNTFASVNPLAQYDSFNVTGGNWAAQLVKFVDKVKRAGETHAIANLSFDLSQLDDIGITTRYELTPAEQQAIQYARDNNVLLVVASGNTGGVMSALGQASQKFDNIITVGAVNQFQSKTDYSAYGNGLTLMAPGGSWQDDAGAFVGTSRATAYVSAAASLVWAANPELSFLQVKQLLIDTAADLDVEGWDVLTGAGLVDIKEALDRATFIEAEGATTGLPLQVNPFSGEGRSKTLARPAGDKTEQAIIDLDNIQQTLLEQWQVLADLGNPALTLGELDAEVQTKIAEAFKTYQQVSTDAEITTAQAQQWAEALALATQHYQIEQGRLLELQARQKELEEQLAGLGQQKTALEAETQQLLDGIKAQIAKAEEDLAKSQAKLANPFANADDNLQFNSQSFLDAAAKQQKQVQTFRQQAGALAGESQHYQAVANSINPNRWQVVGSSSSLSGRRREVWGWGQNPQLVQQKNQYQWLAGITALNSQILQQLAAQTDQQAAALQQYGNLLEDRKNTLNLGSGSTDDAATVLQLLQEQAAQQQALANNYAQQAAIAEKRRRESQANADWHNSLINRWEVVGTRRTGKSGRNVENVYGWRHYPEHIAPRNRAQQLAWQAAGERQTYDQLAQEAQKQASALAEQARKLQERLRDWPVLKQGIEYEIAADSLRLQAEQDLLAMHEPVQEQKLETLNLQISQTEEELQTLTGEKLPAQQQLTDATEQRLQETQSEVEAIQQEREAAKKDLQNFLETAGFLLPYRERLAAVEKTIQQLEDDKLKVQETMQALTIALLQTPSETLRQQLNHWGNYVETLEQELDWAKLQKDQLALALTDSPERLAISGLIKELEAEKGTAVADDVPLQRYIDFLRGIEGSGANFLEGFDNLEQRLAAAKTEQKDAEKALKQLLDEYRNLGLQKSNLEDKLIPAKEQEIKTTQENIAATETTLANLQTQLTGLQDDQAQKAVEVANQEAVVATTQAQTQAEIANIQTQINATDAQIQQKQAVADSYHAPIKANHSAALSYEQQRAAYQDAANYWNKQIWQFNEAAYLAYNPDVAKAVAERWWGRSSSGWYHYVVYGQFEGRLPNPQAAANRNAYQNAANYYLKLRDAANEQVKQLMADFNATNQQINALNQQKAALVQQQQAQRDKLAAEQATMQRLQQELQAISQQINTLQANIQQQEQKLDGLNNLLAQQQQQLADLQAQIPLLEQQLIDKYRQIELTENYLSQVEAEVNRLDARLDLLNRAGILEQQYQDNWQKWQQASLDQTQATEALIATRQAGESDRTLLASLQSQLTQAQTNLQTAQTLQQSITDTLQAVEFSKLQLGNQQLLMQSLIDRENSLAALERYYLNLAEQHRQRIWATGGYNAGEADAYRNYLEQASFIADLRNKGWQDRHETQQKINQLNQQIAQQQSQIATQTSQLQALGGIAHIQARITQINAAINAVNQRLQPLEILEKQQTDAITNAGSLTEHLTSELVQTAQLQATALQQLIGFGILASESDVDFFLTQVEPNVNSAIAKLREREQELTAQVQSAASRTATAQQQLANTTDEVSKQALTNLIAQLQGQQSNLEALQAENEKAADELEDLLKQANDSLTPLRQKQELEIRQKLESNDERLQALQSQLNSENAAENAVNADTVLAYAQLNDQIRQDLTLNASNWTQQLLDGNQMTKELGTSQQNLSAAVDDLIAYINDNFADPHGEYNRTEADLRDGITTLGVLENRADELDSAFTSTEDAIERIKLRIAQDAALWDEIAPIAIRYGLESEQLKEYLQMPGDVKTRRAAFLEKYPDNGTAIDLLQAATLEGSNPNQQISQQLNAPYADTLLNAPAVEGRNPLQALFDKSKAAQASHEAQGYALLAQANWYEQQAAYHWAHSRKNGPYWYEQRWVKGSCGKGHWETVTHVDHHWIVWQQYSQLFPQLRQQGYAHLVEADKWRKEKERLEPLKNQWIEANDAANEANPVVKEARNFFAELEAGRSDIPQAQTQLEFLETLLPTLKQQLEEAEAEAAAQNAKVQQEWEDYDTDSEEYRAAVADILQRRGELNKQAIETQQQLAESERWVEQQTVALSAELDGTKTLIDALQKQRQNLAAEMLDLVNQDVLVDDLDDFYTKDAQLEQSLQMLTNKAAVLTAQQTALTQKRTLLTAQNEVILAEQRLLDAYINDPDADTSNLEQQLLDARAALAEAQRLAEQAEAASKALTAPLQDIKNDLLAQNDEHLKAAQEHQKILRALVEATQSNANYTLQAAQKQQEVNNLEFQILQRLQQATAAGYQQAKHLLDVAQYNDMATAAELYYRDYKDLASDRGGCAGGAGTAQDAILADQYYREMLNQRELQRRAQAQADAFRVAKETAEAQMNVLQQQQATAQQLLDDLNAKVAETQEQREQKQQELAIAQARLDGITRIREQTEQTFTQLVTLEKLNLAQAQLEQEIAQNRQADIDEAVAARQERDQIELERKRLETQARIEQLRQLQAEDDVRQNLNQVRSQLGLATLDATDDPVQLQTQLAGLLTNLQDLQTQQPDLPENVKTLLAEAQGDIHLALQGKEAANIQQNLLNAMDGLVAQIESYKTEINRLDLEEQWDNQLLQTAQSDLQGASQQLLKELDRAAALSGEHDVIDPLYMEMLNKVALADQAVEISQEMAEQSKEILDQIIKQRIAERKARKKAFWNKILGIVSGVIGILGTILSFTPLAPLGIALGVASAGINAIQSFMNGDWLGGIFGIVMAGVGAFSSSLGNAIKAVGSAAGSVWGMGLQTAKNLLTGINALQSIGSGVFNGVRSIMSGQGIMGALNILGGIAGAGAAWMKNIINECSSTLQKTMSAVFNTLKDAPMMIYQGIQGIKNGDWFGAISGLFNAAISMGSNFAGVFNDAASQVFDYLGKAGNTVLAIGGAIKNGSIESWLSGINSVIGLWGEDIKGWVENISGKEECCVPCPDECDTSYIEGGYYDAEGGFYDTEGGYYDAEGGYYDTEGGYYDTEGGYYDAEGGYYDTEGGYYDAEGGYYDAEGGYYDALGGYYYSDGDYYHPWLEASDFWKDQTTLLDSEDPDFQLGTANENDQIDKNGNSLGNSTNENNLHDEVINAPVNGSATANENDQIDKNGNSLGNSTNENNLHDEVINAPVNGSATANENDQIDKNGNSLGNSTNENNLHDEVINAPVNGSATASNNLFKGASAGSLKRPFYNGGVIDGAMFAQKSYNGVYSKEGEFVNWTVDKLADALNKGSVKPEDVPIQYVEREGKKLILNTRSSAALEKAGIPRSEWNVINKTGDRAPSGTNELHLYAENRLDNQLKQFKKDANGKINWGELPKKISDLKYTPKGKPPQGNPVPIKGSALSKVAKGANKVLGPLAVGMDILQLSKAYEKDGGKVGQSFKSTLGGIAGGWTGGFVGAQTGAVIGGTIGSVIPGVGTAAGVFVGGLVGGISGAIGGSKLGEDAAKKYWK